VLDNSYGKVRRFHEAWTRDSQLVRWCDDPAEALRLVRQPWPVETGA
jgi:exopolysaccharide biosynthesis predicted pyruvyltransferase EpsI